MNIYQAPTRFVGKNTKYINSCASTNALAFEESLHTDVPEGFAWIAGHQTAGKGQRGNQWLAEPNQNLLLSYALKPPSDLLKYQFYLSKCIAIGLIKGIQNWAQIHVGHEIPAKIKWPNDIYIEDFKLGGILIESNFISGKWAFSIVGIGLNINQTVFEGLRACSLRQWSPTQNTIDISEVFNHISIAIEHAYDQFLNLQFSEIDAHYHKQLFRFQEWHTFQDNTRLFLGKIKEVDALGQIQIEQESGQKGYDIKEINFIFSD